VRYYEITYHTIPYSFNNVADIRNLQQYCSIDERVHLRGTAATVVAFLLVHVSSFVLFSHVELKFTIVTLLKKLNNYVYT